MPHVIPIPGLTQRLRGRLAQDIHAGAEGIVSHINDQNRVVLLCTGGVVRVTRLESVQLLPGARTLQEGPSL